MNEEPWLKAFLRNYTTCKNVCKNEKILANITPKKETVQDVEKNDVVKFFPCKGCFFFQNFSSFSTFAR